MINNKNVKVRAALLITGLFLGQSVQALQINGVDLGKDKVEQAQLLESDQFLKGADKLVSYKDKNIAIKDRQEKTLATLTGAFGAIDHRVDKQGLLLAAIDLNKQQVLVANWPEKGTSWQKRVYIPKTPFDLRGICLYRDNTKHDYAFLIGREGKGQQWLVGENSVPLTQPQLMRDISLPLDSTFCQVDDHQSKLYVNEGHVGLWQYNAEPDPKAERSPVAMVKPFGSIKGSVAGMAVLSNGVALLDSSKHSFYLYQHKLSGWVLAQQEALDGVKKPETISIRQQAKQVSMLVTNKKGDVYQASMPWVASKEKAEITIPVVKAEVQTTDVPSIGDAADDPAIWVNANDPSKSEVLGTDKKGGLLVYDMSGKQRQDFRVGRLNNVDIRKGFKLGDKIVDLAMATNRDHNSLQAFAIDTKTGVVTSLGELPTTMEDIYGFCMFKDHENRIYAIANNKEGDFNQYLITDTAKGLKADLVRNFKVKTQPEGCVADDKTERLYLGEEDVAVWAVDARADKPAKLDKVITVGGLIKDDIEGVSVYLGKKHSYIVFSSQGNNRYAVVDAKPPYKFRGVFRVGINAQKHIDGTSETDGLDVTSVNLGGIWSQGMLVVQDGHKRMPEGNQNYKYIPWASVVKALKLP